MIPLRTLKIAALFLLFAASSGAEPSSGPLTIRVYHTNDVHGWIMARPDRQETTRRVGGAAALKSLLDKDRGPKLVLDAGDWWQGTPEGSLSKGAAVAEVFNAIGYDAVEVGNHDFDAGLPALTNMISALKMPVLAANIYDANGRRVSWTQPHILREVGEVKIGIFGLVTRKMDKLAFPANIEGLTFRREIDEAADQVKALRKEGADVIVAVTHVGYEQPDLPAFEGDRAIAAAVEGIDLIVGGHSHTFLRRPWKDPVHGTLVVQAGCYLTKVGRTTLMIDPKTHRVTASEDELLDLWPDLIGEDPAVGKIIARRTAEVGAAFDVVIATAAEILARGDGLSENGIGSWVADCYRRRFGVDFALQNGGGIRAEIPAGPVTVRGIFNVMPFDNVIVRLKMTGAQLRAVLTHGVGMGRIVQESGAIVSYRRPAEPANRLQSVEINGAPLDDTKSYSVATLDFLVSGGDGYSLFGQAETQESTGVLARDALLSCAREQGILRAPPPGRLKPLSGG